MPKIIPDVEKKLLAAARKILSRDGFDNLSMKEIAKESKMSVGTIYNYFPEKSSILVKIVAEDWADLVERTNAYNSTVTNIRDGLKKIYDECIGFSIGHIGVFSHFAVENNDAYRASYRAFIEGTAGLIEFLCEHFGLHHTHEECMIATSIFSFAIHYPETQFEPLANAIEKLL
ncbi:MAG: helix-turn-helix transcriptional regulator [Bacilli bacterium]|nr:helix-turn-helix transcriptional regulator [Bacilli bacterium]